MKTALFTNFSDEEFVGFWDGKSKTFKAGQSLWMPDYLAKHFATHLANRELQIKYPMKDKDGNLLFDDKGNQKYKEKYPKGETMTSPKKPEEMPIFMKLFNKAYTPDNEDEMGSEKDDIDTLISTVNKNKQERGLSKEETPVKDSATEKQEPQEDWKESDPNKQDPAQPQVVLPADYGEDDDSDDESSFAGKPVEK
jgi:hypothetical protein